jgi:hypothetical protein
LVKRRDLCESLGKFYDSDVYIDELEGGVLVNKLILYILALFISINLVQATHLTDDFSRSDSSIIGLTNSSFTWEKFNDGGSTYIESGRLVTTKVVNTGYAGATCIEIGNKAYYDFNFTSFTTTTGNGAMFVSLNKENITCNFRNDNNCSGFVYENYGSTYNRVDKYINGTSAGSIVLTTTNSVYYHYRIRYNNSHMYFKRWNSGNSEPAGWNDDAEYNNTGGTYLCFGRTGDGQAIGQTRFDDIYDLTSTKQILFKYINPKNDTGINSSRDLNYYVNNFTTTVNCTFYVDGVEKSTKNDSANGIHNFTYDITSQIEGNHTLNISCNDNSDGVLYTDTKSLFIDKIRPNILFINYSSPSEVLINQTLPPLLISLQTAANDTNLYSINMSVIRSNYESVFFSNQSQNIPTAYYDLNSTFNSSEFPTGWFDVTVNAKDAHTKKKINFDKNLKESTFENWNDIGLMFDSSVITHMDKSKVTSFETIESFDRKKFKVKFKRKVTDFDVYITSTKSIDYLGTSYGYLGHFIIDDKYWLDLENDANSKIVNVEQVDDLKYKVSMIKDPKFEEVIFNSIGVINQQNRTTHFYLKNYNISQLNLTLYNSSNLNNISLTFTGNQTHRVYINILRYVDLKDFFMSIRSDSGSIPNIWVSLFDLNSRIFEETNFDRYMTSNDFADEIYTDLSNCNCQNCTQIGNNCSFPIYVHSDTAATINLNNLFMAYETTSSNLSINVYDSNTLARLTENVTISIAGDFYSNQTTTITGQYNTTVPLNATPLLYTVRAYSTNILDYSIVSREITINPSASYTLDIYLTNTSDVTKTKTITFTVQDVNAGNRVQGATVRVEKQYPPQNKFLIITDIRTNPQGQGTTILELDTVFYQYTVFYQGRTVFASAFPTPITSDIDEIFLPVNLEESFRIYYDSLFRIDNDLTWVNSSDTTGRFRSEYTSESTVQVCMNVTIVNLTGIYEQEYVCSNNIADTIQSTPLAATNITTYNAIVTADFFDGFGHRMIDSLTQRVGYRYQVQFRDEGLFIMMAAISLSAFGFMASPVVGLIVLIISFGAIYLMQITYLTPMVLSFLIALIIFTLITISRRK